MIKRVLLLAGLAALALAIGCNKQKPAKLDYSEQLKDGVYSNHGLPGEGYVGRTPAEERYHGLHGEDDHAARPPADEAKPDEAKPDEPKPDEPKPDADEADEGAGSD